MHIRKVFGLSTVQLPDGGYLSRGDLPPPNTKGWVTSRNAAVVKVLHFDLISLEEACSLYDLTQDEYSSCLARRACPTRHRFKKVSSILSTFYTDRIFEKNYINQFISTCV